MNKKKITVISEMKYLISAGKKMTLNVKRKGKTKTFYFFLFSIFLPYEACLNKGNFIKLKAYKHDIIYLNLVGFT